MPHAFRDSHGFETRCFPAPPLFLGESSFTGRWLVVAVTTWYARETTDGTNETALLELELKVRAGGSKEEATGGWNLPGLSDWSDYFFEGSWNDRNGGGDTDQWSQWPWCIARNSDLTIMCTGDNTFGGWILNAETNARVCTQSILYTSIRFSLFVLVSKIRALKIIHEYINVFRTFIFM